MKMANPDDSEQKPGSQSELPRFCYGTAYFALPRLLFSQPERTLGYFVDNEYPEGPYLYMMATRILKVEPVREHALLFQAHCGELSPGKNYHILEYPAPPPFDLAQKGAVLSPFFSAIIHNTADNEVAYYVLGQNPVSGTTFRTVTPDGANANMGPGPQPELEAFIDFLRQRA
jgi:hypothetical protein